MVIEMTDYLIYFRDGTAYRDIYPDVRSARKSAVKLIKAGMNVHRIIPITKGTRNGKAQYIDSRKLRNGWYSFTIEVWNPQRKQYSLHALYEDGTISKY